VQEGVRRCSRPKRERGRKGCAGVVDLGGSRRRDGKSMWRWSFLFIKC